MGTYHIYGVIIAEISGKNNMTKEQEAILENLVGKYRIPEYSNEGEFLILIPKSYYTLRYYLSLDYQKEVYILSCTCTWIDSNAFLAKVMMPTHTEIREFYDFLVKHNIPTDTLGYYVLHV
jgi:hypothetical protein